MSVLRFAYYCSGHGYGHATRVCAFVRHLLMSSVHDRPIIYVVSSAPKHIFTEIIARGAIYRYAEIDPTIIQPLAYHIDRQKSVEVLKGFLEKKDVLLQREREWLVEIQAHAVLSDVAFLGCLAAKASGIPSVIVSNFTFDTVYSYLSIPILDIPIPSESTLSGKSSSESFAPDSAVSAEELAPLVDEIHAGYRCADLLLLLPGFIPVTAFSTYPELPSSAWVDEDTKRLRPEILFFLSQPVETYTLNPPIPFPQPFARRNTIPRGIRLAPLLVRLPSDNTRAQLLASVGIPEHLRDTTKTKILVVSFGGHSFGWPERKKSSLFNDNVSSLPPPAPTFDLVSHPSCIATPSHMWIPGAPPTSKPPPMAPGDVAPSFMQHSKQLEVGTGEIEDKDNPDNDGPRYFPDSSYIAIICGISTEQSQDEYELPEGFYIAPKDVYMPDLTAVADVLLGKLGYGTVSECVATCTPFVYVSRPLFIEEHGMRLLLEREGVGIELSRQSYEAGAWSSAVQEAWIKGRGMKAKMRGQMASGIAFHDREEQGRKMATGLVSWVREWWNDIEIDMAH